ncbi:MAG: D-alanyl-D-alanine carboxypeptidase [Chitinophagaceae bacterium]|nr:D-alanyl-D-alanine carboxypeptidase [Chitinophagaceae bacterium]
MANNLRQLIILNSALLILLSSCSIEKQISKSVQADVLNIKALQTAHVGISIYDPAANKYLYNYQGDKYFVPASNTKIPTCYAAMKYLGDSLVGLKYGFSRSKGQYDSAVLGIQPSGDPTFLHPDYKRQPVWDFFSANSKKHTEAIGILDTIWQEGRWGSGWSWTDYDASYMAERNVMPIYGNVINIKLNNPNQRGIQDTTYPQLSNPKMFKTQHPLFDTMVNANTYLLLPDNLLSSSPLFQIKRSVASNNFWFDKSTTKFSNTSIPFVTWAADGLWSKYSSSMTLDVISSDLKFRFGIILPQGGDSSYAFIGPDSRSVGIKIKEWHVIHSQPTDSVLKPMMHRSDNFFAEQNLLMVSNEKLGVMNDAKIIDTILKTDFKDLPQKPRWADGSGLSRYNLFTPQSFVAILNKMKNEFGMERIKVIFPTGGEGTISSYYKADSGYIYAKTGTLSGVVAFSGYLYTRKGKLLIFSTLVNNHQASATDIRRAIEKFLQGIRNRY